MPVPRAAVARVSGERRLLALSTIQAVVPSGLTVTATGSDVAPGMVTVFEIVLVAVAMICTSCDAPSAAMRLLLSGVTASALGSLPKVPVVTFVIASVDVLMLARVAADPSRPATYAVGVVAP